MFFFFSIPRGFSGLPIASIVSLVVSQKVPLVISQVSVLKEELKQRMALAWASVSLRLLGFPQEGLEGKTDGKAVGKALGSFLFPSFSQRLSLYTAFKGKTKRPECHGLLLT